MKFPQIAVILFLIASGFIGCYTIISHPTVKKGDYSQRVKFYNDCFSCHSNTDMIEYGYDYVNQNPSWSYIGTNPIWVTPTYVPPWWLEIRYPVEENQSPQRPNDRTGLRDMDGGRTLSPANFDIPSRNSGSSNNSSSSNSSSNNSLDSSKERNSRESSSTKSRDNSGERKK